MQKRLETYLSRPLNQLAIATGTSRLLSTARMAQMKSLALRHRRRRFRKIESLTSLTHILTVVNGDEITLRTALYANRIERSGQGGWVSWGRTEFAADVTSSAQKMEVVGVKALNKFTGEWVAGGRIGESAFHPCFELTCHAIGNEDIKVVRRHSRGRRSNHTPTR